MIAAMPDEMEETPPCRLVWKIVSYFQLLPANLTMSGSPKLRRGWWVSKAAWDVLTSLMLWWLLTSNCHDSVLHKH